MGKKAVRVLKGRKMAVVGFGKIQKFGDVKDKNGDPVTARVVPEDSDGALTLELYIPFEMRKLIKNVQINEDVLYCVKKDGTGVILYIVPDYTNDIFDDWDYIIRNNVVLQINGNVHVKGTLTVDKDVMMASNMLVEGNADVIGNLSVDGDSYLSKGLEILGSNTNIGGTVTIDGTTSSGAKAFNGFPAGSDTFTGAAVSRDVVNAVPLSGGKANGNMPSYEKAEDNNIRTVS